MAAEFPLAELAEDPDRVEAAYEREQKLAESDPERRARLESIYAEKDRGRAFERFAASRELAAIEKLLKAIPAGPDTRIVELGGGAGFLSWALQSKGYASVDLVEPNGHWTTGTGYLESRSDHSVRVWNDLDEWYRSNETYDLVVTRNCVHHFPPLPYVAACVRSKLRRNGAWLMLREAFTDGYEETIRRVASHPYATRYGLYEFFFNPEYYVQGMREGGFRLEAVIPGRYEGGVLETFAENKVPTLPARILTRVVDEMLARRKGLTRIAYEAELLIGKVASRTPRRFSRPPALLFRRTEES